MSRRTAFTLIELLAVIAIIAVLVSILMPSLSGAKEQARKILCANTLHNMNIATFQYLQDYRHRMPGWDWSYAPFSGLLVDNRITTAMLICPSGVAKVGGYPNRSYSANAWICYCRWQYDYRIALPAQTLMYVEEDEYCIDNEHWAVRQDLWWNMIAARHRPRGANLGFVDGHLEFWQWKWPSTGVYTVQYASDPGNPDLDRLNRAQCPPLVPN